MPSMRTYLSIPEDRTVKVAGEQATHFKVTVDYSKGGMNYFTYKTSPRGYYLYVTPVIREAVERHPSDGPGGPVTFDRTALTGEGAGFKVLLKETTRLNRKTLSLCETVVNAHLHSLLPLLLDANREGILQLTAKMKEAL
jgi:hypothetical protein